MKYEILFNLPQQTITVEAETEWEAEDLADRVLDGIQIDKSFRLEEIEMVGMREVKS